MGLFGAKRLWDQAGQEPPPTTFSLCLWIAMLGVVQAHQTFILNVEFWGMGITCVHMQESGKGHSSFR